MRSAEDVKTSIIDYLKSVLPARCDAIGTELGADSPAPKKYVPHGYRELGLEEWPALFIEEANRLSIVLMDRVDATKWYAVRWAFHIELWARSKKKGDFEEAEALRARLERAVIEATLDRQSLNKVGFDVDEASVSTSFSPMFQTSQGQPACACEVRVTFISAESVPDIPLSESPTEIDVLVVEIDQLEA